MKINYDQIMEKEIQRIRKEGANPKLLLHCCCGPCSTSVIERLLEDFDLLIFFYNPNIGEKEEYERRKENLIKYLNLRYEGNSCLTFSEGDYRPEDFHHFGKILSESPEGGVRCGYCFQLRLMESAKVAKEMGCSYFTTTLTVSPMKDAKLINELGKEIGEKENISFLIADFKKKGGYDRSIQLSKEFGLYRQDYCGCVYSKRCLKGEKECEY